MPSLPGELCDIYCGTPGYAAPEVLDGYNLLSYDPYCAFKADIYSLWVDYYHLFWFSVFRNSAYIPNEGRMQQHWENKMGLIDETDFNKP